MLLTPIKNPEGLNMKQVWILNHYAQEPGGAGGTRHFHLAEHLFEFGWQGTVIAASVELNTGRQRLAPQETLRYEKIQGVPFLWVRTPEYEGNGGGRIMNMLAYTWNVLKKRTTSELPRPHVVIGSSVHPLAAVAGMILARRFKVPFIFEVRDLWPRSLIDVGRLREDQLLTRILYKIELWLYRRASRIIVLLPKAWEYICPLGIPKERVVWIPNGVDLSLFPRAKAVKASSSRDFTLMYFGAHGHANGLDNILSAMQYVNNSPFGKNIRLRMVGNGPLKSALVDKAKKMGLTNISFEPPVPKSQVPMLAAQADAFVISVRDLPNLYRYGISMNKLFDYLAAERPILISSDAVNNPVAEAEAGFSVPADRPELLADAILKVARIPLEERQRMGRAGREYVEKNHSFQQLAAKLSVVLDEVCTEASIAK